MAYHLQEHAMHPLHTGFQLNYLDMTWFWFRIKQTNHLTTSGRVIEALTSQYWNIFSGWILEIHVVQKNLAGEIIRMSAGCLHAIYHWFPN